MVHELTEWCTSGAREYGVVHEYEWCTRVHSGARVQSGSRVWSDSRVWSGARVGVVHEIGARVRVVHKMGARDYGAVHEY